MAGGAKEEVVGGVRDEVIGGVIDEMRSLVGGGRPRDV